jgi:hypothetical protein
MNASKWPLDYELLARGTTLTREQVENATNLSARDERYRLAALRLAHSIREHFAARGDFVTVISEGDTLRILTHAEQSRYAPQREAKAIRQIMVARAEGNAVDTKQLTDSEREWHEAWLRRNSWRAQQLLKPPPLELT